MGAKEALNDSHCHRTDPRPPRGVLVKRLFVGILDTLALVFLIGGSRAQAGKRSRVSWRKVHARCGSLRIGDDCIVHARIDLEGPAGLVTIGNRTYVGASHIVCRKSVEIGDDVIVSWGVTIVDHDSHSLDAHQRQEDVVLWSKGQKSWEGVGIKPVRICNRVWIGFDAAILKGVTIGEGSVVGAKSVVTRDVPPYCLVAGNPARIVRKLCDGTA